MSASSKRPDTPDAGACQPSRQSANPTDSPGSWKPTASWRNEPPTPPDKLRKNQRRRRLKRSKGAGSLARFFTKQVVWFLILVTALLMIDVMLYVFIATQEMDRNYLYGTPATVTRTVSDQLTADSTGVYSLGSEAQTQLEEQGAWAQLVSPDGTVLWSCNVPEASEEPTGVVAREPSEPGWGAVPSTYTTNQLVLVAHFHTVNGYPAFIWDRSDGILLVGFPQGSYETMSITWPEETWRTIPLYVFGIILFDLLILFAAYVIYRRRTQKAVEPINEALEALSRGGRAQLDLKGDLQPIADQINETSDVLEHKDRAREQWIRGVSHDIRTPLSMIIGKADGIVSSHSVSESTRVEARAIRAQGMKIKDLVADLNTASQLSFQSDPLTLERVFLPKLLRDIAASYINSGFDETHPLSFTLDEDCADAVVLGDVRMLTRMVENLLANARLHNMEGCSVELTLSACTLQHEPGVELCVSDDGVGISDEQDAKLKARIAQARVAPDDALPDDSGHGLGLVLVDRIARAHGGIFEVRKKSCGFSGAIILPRA